MNLNVLKGQINRTSLGRGGEDPSISETAVTSQSDLSARIKSREYKTRNTEKRIILNPILVG